MTNLTLPVRLDPDSAPDETLHVTASGLPVRIYALDGGGDRPIHGAVYIDDEWLPRTWLPSGRYERSAPEHVFDLRDRPKAKRGVWVAWFEHEKSTAHYAVARDSKEEAIAPRYKCCLKGVTYLKEGDGLDTPADPPLWVDWSQLPEWAQWAAADEDGEIWGYDKKPEKVECLWHVTGEYQCRKIRRPIYRLAPGFDWRTTLIQRPEDV